MLHWKMHGTHPQYNMYRYIEDSKSMICIPLVSQHVVPPQCLMHELNIET